MTLRKISPKRKASVRLRHNSTFGAKAKPKKKVMTIEELKAKGVVVRASTVKRKTTGEIAKLDQMIRERGPYSEISGLPLAPKGHPRYHYQIFHVLPKGTYPDLRLEDDNLLLTTWEEQDLWTNKRWTLRDKPEWQMVFDREQYMKQRVYQP